MTNDLHPSQVAELETLREQNKTSLAELQSIGGDLDPMSVLHRRLELLVKWLSLLCPDLVTAFEFEYETEMAGVLKNASSTVRKAQLTVNLGRHDPRIVLPGG